jgi:hypothetical protein
MGFQGFEFFGAYSGDLLEFVGGGEAAVFGTPVEDSLGEDWADARQAVQLGEGGRVEVDWRVGGRSRSTGWLAWIRCADWCGCGHSDDDLLAVGDLAGQVEGCQVDSGQGSARSRQYVGDTRARRCANQPGATDLAGNVHYDRGRRT